MVTLLRLLMLLLAVRLGAIADPSMAVARCRAKDGTVALCRAKDGAYGDDRDAPVNAKVLTVGGRTGNHIDLVVFMRSDGSVISCATVHPVSSCLLPTTASLTLPD
jgi:hypothetical protein